MKDSSAVGLVQFDLPDAANLLGSGGSVVFLTGTLYRNAQIIHPRSARFSLKNKNGLYFVKVYRAALVNQAGGLEPGTTLGVIGEMHSFVSRRCKNHHVFIRATALFNLTEPCDNWVAKISQLQGSYLT